jgi:PKD repeat protein
VHVIGDGVGKTIIEGEASEQVAVTLLSPLSSIEDLTIRIADESGAAALRWDGTASNIEAVHDGEENTINGMFPEDSAVLEESVVSVKGATAVTAPTATDATIRDSTISAGGTGITTGQIPGTTGVTISRSSVAAGQVPLLAADSEDSIAVDNSVVRATSASSTFGAITALPGTEVEADHVTVMGKGSDLGVEVVAGPEPASAVISNSIIDVFDEAFACAGSSATATLMVEYSSFDDEFDVADPECEETLEPGNDETTDPVFAGIDPLAPDLHLRAPSPLIDAADPADPAGLDLDGRTRVVDGDATGGARSDMGAYEYQRLAPEAAIDAPATAAPGESVAFSASDSTDPDPGDTLAYSWDFGDGGTAEGVAPQHAFDAEGKYEVELTVTDQLGLTGSKIAEIQISVPPPAPAQPGKSPKSPKAPKPKKPKKPKAGVAITDLRAVPKRIRRGKGLPKLVKGLKRPGFQFKLSKASDVTLTLVRCKGKRGCRKRARIKGSATFKAAKGSSTIKFRGRLTRKKLRKGRYRATLRAGRSSARVVFRLV